MAKGKAKNSSDGVAPPQPRSLRPRKRRWRIEEWLGTKTEDVQTVLHHQETEGSNPAVDPTLLQGHQSPLKESMISNQQQLTEQDPAAEEKKHVGATDVTVKALEGQEHNTVTNPNNDSQLEGLRVNTENDDANKSTKDKQEMTEEECDRASPSQTRTDHLQVFLQTSEEQPGAGGENPLSHSEKKQETSRENPGAVHVVEAEIAEISNDAAEGLPVKKKRRMGMCGRTEKEWSLFLQAQKRENGQSTPEKAICKGTADLLAQEEIISSPSSLSIPLGSVLEQNEAEIKLRSSQCVGDDSRVDNGVHVDVTTSDGTSTVCEPVCSEAMSCEAAASTVPGPDQTGDIKTDPPAEEEKEVEREEEKEKEEEEKKEVPPGIQEQQELEGCAAENMAEKLEEPMKKVEEDVVPAASDRSLADSFPSNPTTNEETEDGVAVEAAPLLANIENGTREEKTLELTAANGHEDGAEARAESGSAPTHTESGGTSGSGSGGGCGDSCAATVAPSGPERKDSCDPIEPGPSIMNADPPQTRDTVDPFGSGCLDYVSDSQLNTIVLTEEVVMEKRKVPGSPDCPEDATDLISGLIRELSSINRKVMATHRELENLRRRSIR